MDYRIKEFDALRGLAVIAIVIFHFTLYQSHQPLYFRAGCLGVDLFFIISGFAIFFSVKHCASWKDFIVNRFSRLYPVYWASLLLVCFLILRLEYITIHSTEFPLFIKGFFYHLTLFHYYFNVDDYDGPYWTMAIEMGFYCYITFLYITRIIQKIELINGVILIVLMIFLFISPDINMNSGVYPLAHKLILLKYFPLFVTGINVYKMKFENINSYRVLLFLLCFFIQISLYKYYHNIQFVSKVEYISALSGIYFLLILYLSNWLKPIANIVLCRFGEISYSLYLNHYFIGCSVIIPYLKNRFHFSSLSAILLTFIICTIIATLMNRLIERPFAKIIRNFYIKKLVR